MIIMDDNARLQLQKMIKANDVEDMTGLIRELKHSILLRNEINILLKLMRDNKNSEDNTYTLVPYDNQNMTIYNYIVKSQGMDLNAFISNNNNDINNKIAKFKFNKIS